MGIKCKRTVARDKRHPNYMEDVQERWDIQNYCTALGKPMSLREERIFVSLHEQFSDEYIQAKTRWQNENCYRFDINYKKLLTTIQDGSNLINSKQIISNIFNQMKPQIFISDGNLGVDSYYNTVSGAIFIQCNSVDTDSKLEFYRGPIFSKFHKFHLTEYISFGVQLTEYNFVRMLHEFMLKSTSPTIRDLSEKLLKALQYAKKIGVNLLHSKYDLFVKIYDFNYNWCTWCQEMKSVLYQLLDYMENYNETKLRFYERQGISCNPAFLR